MNESIKVIQIIFVSFCRIVSTREVAPQQSELSLDAAQQYRLQLMEERKWDKLRLNVRDIELCEH